MFGLASVIQASHLTLQVTLDRRLSKHKHVMPHDIHPSFCGSSDVLAAERTPATQVCSALSISQVLYPSAKGFSISSKTVFRDSSQLRESCTTHPT